MLPLLGCAKRAGIAVAILDPNAHYSKVDGPLEHVQSAIDRLLWPTARAVKQRQLLMMAYGHGGHLVARLLSRNPKLLDLAPAPGEACDARGAAAPGSAAPGPAIPTLRALGLIESSHKLKGDSAASAAARVFFSERTLNWCVLSMSSFAYLPMLTHLVCLHMLTYQFTAFASSRCGGERLAMERVRGVHSPIAAVACNTIAVGDADSEHRALAIATSTPAVFIFFEIALRRALIDFSDPQVSFIFMSCTVMFLANPAHDFDSLPLLHFAADDRGRQRVG